MADGGSHSIASLLVTSEFCDQLMLSKALIAALVVLVGVILGTAHVRQQNRIEVRSLRGGIPTPNDSNCSYAISRVLEPR